MITAQKLGLSSSGRSAAIADLHLATAIYTAEPVVDDLLSELRWPFEQRRFVDPSCGDGSFLVRALERLLAYRPAISDAEIVACVEGWEIHPGAAKGARARLARALIAHGRPVRVAVGVASRVVRNADFLTEGPSVPTYHAIGGNPPYLRWLNVPQLLRDEYREVLGEHAQADLLHSFLDRSAQALATDGEMAWVTADRWLFGLNAAALRQSIGARFSIHHLRRLDSATSFYRPKQRRAGSPPRIHPVAVVMRSRREGTIPLTKAAIYPDGVPTPSGHSRTLGDVAEIRLAPWLGPPGIFVVDQSVAANLPREHLVPAVDTDDIKDGELGDSRRFVILTSRDMEPPAAIQEHLNAALHRMAPRGRRSPNWLPPESFARLNLDRPALLIPRIARTLRPIKLPAGILPINHNLHIVAGGCETLERIGRYLSSPEAERWLLARAARLESGFFSISMTLLRSLPFPDA